MAVNALLSRPGLLSPGEAGVDGALLSSLIEWADGTLQQRFSGAARCDAFQEIADWGAHDMIAALLTSTAVAPLRVLGLQVQCTPGAIKANCAAAAELIRAHPGHRLYVLPELSATGYFDSVLGALDEWYMWDRRSMMPTCLAYSPRRWELATRHAASQGVISMLVAALPEALKVANSAGKLPKDCLEDG